MPVWGTISPTAGAVRPGAGTGASPSVWWPPVVSVKKEQGGQKGQKGQEERKNHNAQGSQGRRRGSPSWPQDPES